MEFNDSNFNSEVLEYKDGPVLVDFFATWCGPCQMQGPILENLATELKDTKLKIGKLDVDQSPDTTQKYGVMSMPTLIIFVAGEPKETLVGLQNLDVLKEKLESYL
jgi:thioredoxin 1